MSNLLSATDVYEPLQLIIKKFTKNSVICWQFNDSRYLLKIRIRKWKHATKLFHNSMIHILYDNLNLNSETKVIKHV